MSFRTEVNTTQDPADVFTSNACRYATADEADRAGAELASRWFAVRTWRVTESTDPVNYAFPADKSRPEPIHA